MASRNKMAASRQMSQHTTSTPAVNIPTTPMSVNDHCQIRWDLIYTKLIRINSWVFHLYILYIFVFIADTKSWHSDGRRQESEPCYWHWTDWRRIHDGTLSLFSIYFFSNQFSFNSPWQTEAGYVCQFFGICCLSCYLIMSRKFCICGILSFNCTRTFNIFSASILPIHLFCQSVKFGDRGRRIFNAGLLLQFQTAEHNVAACCQWWVIIKITWF